MLQTGSSQTERLLESMVEHWPSMDAPSHRLAIRLRRVYEILERSAHRHLDRAELTRMEFDVLTTLRKTHPPHELRPSDLCHLMLASSGGMSIVLKKLQARGLVALETATHDARSKIVRLTESGSTLIESVAAAVVASERELLSRAAEKEDIDLLADRLAAVLKRLDD